MCPGRRFVTAMRRLGLTHPGPLRRYKPRHNHGRKPCQWSMTSRLRATAGTQEIGNRRRHFPARQHTLEYSIHVGFGTGFAQCVLVVEPDVNDQPDRAGGKAEEQSVAVGLALLYASPVGVLRTERFAETKIGMIGIGRNKLRDGFVYRGQQARFGVRLVTGRVLPGEPSDGLLKLIESVLEQLEIVQPLTGGVRSFHHGTRFRAPYRRFQPPRPACRCGPTDRGRPGRSCRDARPAAFR